ncbi:MAG: hypothetical protein ACRD0J_13585, partial [Acidimicrobiales bacterium]
MSSDRPGAWWATGASTKVLSRLPEACVDAVIFSPAFLRQRDYLADDAEDKELELGQEDTPAAYLDHLLDIVAACRRVLAPHGSLWIELGDVVSGSGGPGGDYGAGGLHEGQRKWSSPASAKRAHHKMSGGGGMADRTRWQGARDGWPMDKCLT